MDGTLTLIFCKSETSEDINTIILPFVYLQNMKGVAPNQTMGGRNQDAAYSEASSCQMNKV